MTNENTVSWREKYRVRIGFVFGILFIWRVQPRNIVCLFIGLLIAFIGILIRQWAAGCVKKMDELATSGPYAMVRHPLYVGSFIAAVGLVFASSSFALKLSSPFLDRTLFYWAVLWILFDSVYMPKILQEEENVRNRFPGTCDDYYQKVPRFLPKEWKFNFSTFELQVWKKNSEYASLLGYGIISLILIGRYLYH